jgi:uncharacterized protein (DUF58 family)
MVRQFERQPTQDLAVFLDLWQPAHAGAAEKETVELAVSLAATVLADRCRRSGSRLLLAVSGTELRYVRGPASPSLLNDLMETLALAEASSHDRLPDLLKNGVERMPPDADAVLISTRRPPLTSAVRDTSATADPRKRTCLDQMLVIDASGEELFDYFEP